ncbi:hypothetical protein GCM10009721_13050 [Terrabacter tumescens]|uniref:Uncharacterized protein n=1 Tax=Terrabacter tumescens TaxID=60443 RepID=A0ABQ2HT56_9MICO|nr:hypothetical protein GCM10009721_13050 [Terrabacter tumescens]
MGFTSGLRQECGVGGTTLVPPTPLRVPQHPALLRSPATGMNLTDFTQEASGK